MKKQPQTTESSEGGLKAMFLRAEDKPQKNVLAQELFAFDLSVSCTRQGRVKETLCPNNSER